MSTLIQPSYTAFSGATKIAYGVLDSVALKVKAIVDLGKPTSVLIFSDVTGEQIDVDLRGTPDDVLRNLQRADKGAVLDNVTNAQRSPGRPKLGVIAREVTLLPRHWQWLSMQPGGASVALRKLVEHASRANHHKDRVRQAQEAGYRFMSAIAGNQPGFEEATRALFASDQPRFAMEISSWPEDIRNHARKLTAAAFTLNPPTT